MKKFLVFMMLHLSLIFSGFLIGSFSVSLPLIMSELGFSDAQMGILGSSNLWGMMIGALSFGFLADRLGRKRLIIISFAMAVLINGMIFFISSYSLFIILRFTTGIGIGAITPLTVSLLSEYFSEQRRTMLLTTLMTGIPIGQLIVALSSMIILESFHWRLLFLMGMFGLLLILLMMLLLPETLPVAAIKQKQEQLFQRKYLRNLIPLCLVFFSNLYVFYGVTIWLPGLMAIQGVALISGILFLAVFLVGNISIPILAGGISERWGYKKVMSFFYLGLIVMIALLSQGHDGALNFLFVFLVGGCVGVAQNMIVAISPRFFPAHMRGSAIGLCSACSRIGSAVAPIIVGFLVTAQMLPGQIFMTFIIPAIIGMIGMLSTCSLRVKAL